MRRTFAILVSLAWPLFLCSSANPYPRERETDKKTANTTQENPKQNKQKGNDATSGQPPAYSANDQSKWKNSDNYQNVSVATPKKPVNTVERVIGIAGAISTVILAMAGIVGIVVAICTLKVIAKQTKATVIAAQASRKSANAAKLSSDALINSERAWILVDIGTLPPFDPSPNEVQILWVFPTVKNYGKTIARITRIAGIVKLIPEGQDLPVVPEYTLGQGFDEQVDTVLPPQVPLQPRLAISGQEFISVREGKFSLFIHGFIEYFDGISEKKRRSAYCFGYVIRGGFSPAETGFYPYLRASREYTECT
ncbi:MAG: hypothetical protein NVS9B4_07180 [Candidatus Acidiferrum sp.]